MIDMREINKEIKQDTPSGFQVDTLLVDLSHHTPDIEEEEQPKVIDLWSRIAVEQFGECITLSGKENLDSLIEPRYACSDCSSEPMRDRSEEEYYCPFCFDTKETLMDY